LDKAINILLMGQWDSTISVVATFDVGQFECKVVNNMMPNWLEDCEKGHFALG